MENKTTENLFSAHENEHNKVTGVKPTEAQFKVGAQLDLEDLIKIIEKEEAQEKQKK